MKGVNSMQPWIYIVLVGLCILVFALLRRQEKNSQSESSILPQVGQLMDHFAADLEEQNEALMKVLQTNKQENEMKLSRMQGHIDSLEDQVSQLALAQAELAAAVQKICSENIQMQPVPDSESTGENSSGLPNGFEIGTPNEPSIRQRYPDIFRLYDQGKSVEYIAKKTEMNKGEVGLILGLAKQEEQDRV